MDEFPIAVDALIPLTCIFETGKASTPPFVAVKGIPVTGTSPSAKLATPPIAEVNEMPVTVR